MYTSNVINFSKICGCLLFLSNFKFIILIKFELTLFFFLKPGDFDYLQIVYSLMDILNLVYKKFLDRPNEVNTPVLNSIKKIDQKFLTTILKVISKDLHKLQESLLKPVGKLDTLLVEMGKPIEQNAVPVDAFVYEAKKRDNIEVQKDRKSKIYENIENN